MLLDGLSSSYSKETHFAMSPTVKALTCLFALLLIATASAKPTAKRSMEDIMIGNYDGMYWIIIFTLHLIGVILTTVLYRRASIKFEWS